MVRVSNRLEEERDEENRRVVTHIRRRTVCIERREPRCPCVRALSARENEEEEKCTGGPSAVRCCIRRRRNQQSEVSPKVVRCPRASRGRRGRPGKQRRPLLSRSFSLLSVCSGSGIKSPLPLPRRLADQSWKGMARVAVTTAWTSFGAFERAMIRVAFLCGYTLY